VRRSHFDDVEERERLCHRAVLTRKGVLGRSSFSRADGVASMVAVMGRMEYGGLGFRIDLV
jgi:hypothetical protein